MSAVAQILVILTVKILVSPAYTKSVMALIHYSNGGTVDSVIVVWEDLHTERSGYFRAFWSGSPNGTVGSPVIGYCSPGGSHRTIKAVVCEVKRWYPNEKVYRNGKEVKV